MSNDQILKVLILEDLATDIALIKRQVLKAYPKTVFTVCTNRDEFIEKTGWFVPDIVLSDYSMPDYNGLEAMLYIKEKHPEVPFIIVTGTLNNEEKAADAILNGASGYVLKDNLNNLSERLPEYVEAGIQRKKQVEEQKEKRRKNRILMQKVMELVHSKQDNDPANEEIIAILSEINENL